MLFGQTANDKLIVGYDLSDTYAQISYLEKDSKDPETISLVAGEENYNIPVVLCKREGVNQWYYGKEALRYAEETGVMLIRNLVSLAKAGGPVEVEGTQFDPVALLALFFKRSMGLLFTAVGMDKITGLMITCHNLDVEDTKVVEQIVNIAKLKVDTVICQSHVESFYYYLLGQQPELLEKRTVLFQRQGTNLVSIVMECNPLTTPRVVYSSVKELEFPFFKEGLPEEIDRELAYQIATQLKGTQADAVYLIGEEFMEEKIPETLEVLCRICRVFQGNNLYSKGACVAMQENLYLPSDLGKSFVYLGREKLKANVGMHLLKQGEESYLALLDAGSNWFEAKKTIELYVKDQNTIEIATVSLVGKENVNQTITLEGLAEGISRIRLQAYMDQPDEIVIEVSDLGFGELRPATEVVWTNRIIL